MSSLVSDELRSRHSTRSVTAEKLLVAAEGLIERIGYEAVTVRQVASAAGVAPATAYTYFSSRDHLFAETFARALAAAPAPRTAAGLTPAERVVGAAEDITAFLAARPQLAAAATRSLLLQVDDVAPLRQRVGREYALRLGTGLDHDTPALVDALTIVFCGALLQAGMGALSYQEVGPRVAPILTTLIREWT